jgi:anthranilate phosphoribosyltransferase
MFLLAAGGAVVVKHGNRGITSQCGGADVLEELGVRIDLPPAALRENIERTGIGFLFAPNYHPSFRMIAPVRKALAARGVATVFNLLGPLLNPAQPPHQLVGVFSRSLIPAFAETFALLRRKHAWAVHGSGGAPGPGIDELSTMGPTDAARVENGNTETFTVTPEQFGLRRVSAEELRGGTRAENARILVGVLDGSIRGAKREVVLLNAAAGFVVAGLARDLVEGIAKAAEQIENGGALARLRLLQALE